jgi:hypothetical protein
VESRVKRETKEIRGYLARPRMTQVLEPKVGKQVTCKGIKQAMDKFNISVAIASFARLKLVHV